MKLRAVAMALVLTMTLTGCGALRNNSRSYRQEQEVSYLINQMVPFGDSLPLSNNATFSTVDLFLVGEIPGVYGNANLQWMLMDTYNRQTTMDYILLDAPASGAYYLNQWLATGDRSHLETYYTFMEKTPKYTKEDFGLWLKVREAIVQGDLSSDLRVVGLDFETSLPMALAYALTLVPANFEATDPHLADLLEAGRQAYYDEVYLNLKVTHFLENWNETNDDYARLGGVADQLLILIQGAQAALEASQIDDDYQFNQLRSDYMAERLIDHTKKNPGKKYFGQVNSLYTMQSEHFGYKWMTAKLLDQVDLNTVTFLLSYEECERLMLVQGVPDRIQLDLFAFDDRGVLGALGEEFTLIEINKKDTLFNKENIIFKKDFEEPPTAYFQYLIVLNNMPAETPLELE